MICWVLAMEMLQGVWKQHLRPRAIVGYGLKIFLPSPPNYVTRSPGWPYAIHFIPTNMVRTRVRGNHLRMRKQNTKITVPLDVVPERRTERCSPRFRPGGRFCELRFRYLSSPTGREGEISRPLDHMRQIPFIHSTRLSDSTNFYIYRTVF